MIGPHTAAPSPSQALTQDGSACASRQPLKMLFARVSPTAPFQRGSSAMAHVVAAVRQLFWRTTGSAEMPSQAPPVQSTASSKPPAPSPRWAFTTMW